MIAPIMINIPPDVFAIEPHALDPSGTNKEILTKEYKKLLSDFSPAGVCIMGPGGTNKTHEEFQKRNNGFFTEKWLKLLIRDLKCSVDHKMIISIDAEGGRVDRLKELKEYGPHISSKAASIIRYQKDDITIDELKTICGSDMISKIDHTYNTKCGNTILSNDERRSFVENNYKDIASKLNFMGFNMNFAPVVDMNDIQNNVIGDRSFGTDKEQVIELASFVCQEFLSKGITPVIKHFPGHGITEQDTHHTQASVDKNPEELEYSMSPFTETLKRNPQKCAVMYSHITCNSVDSNFPSSLSNHWQEQHPLHDSALIVTDCIGMAALEKFGKIKDRMQHAYNANIDLILYCQIKTIEEAKEILQEASNYKPSEKLLNFTQNTNSINPRVKSFQGVSIDI